jgi:hypothetical protein
VYEAVFLNWQRQIFFSAGDDRALVGQFQKSQNSIQPVSGQFFFFLQKNILMI